MRRLEERLSDASSLLRSKEEALSRLEDLYSFATKRVDEEARCCVTQREARARAEQVAQAAGSVRVTLSRCERALARAEAGVAEGARRAAAVEQRRYGWEEAIQRIWAMQSKGATARART